MPLRTKPGIRSSVGELGLQAKLTPFGEPRSPARIEPLPVPGRPPRRRFRRSLTSAIALAAISVCFLALGDWQAHHGLFINASESLPNWAFLIESGKFPARGDYVLFNPGRDPLVLKHFGKKPGSFAKIAYGLPGDVIARDGARVLVNGHEVSRVKPLTRQGEILLPGPVGVIPRGCIFAGTPHKDGFDSRYAEIGFVCRDRLIGVGTPIL